MTAPRAVAFLARRQSRSSEVLQASVTRTNAIMLVGLSTPERLRVRSRHHGRLIDWCTGRSERKVADVGDDEGLASVPVMVWMSPRGWRRTWVMVATDSTSITQLRCGRARGKGLPQGRRALRLGGIGAKSVLKVITGSFGTVINAVN